VGPHTGYFVQWLAATVYGDEFFTPENQVYPDQLLDSKPLPIPLDIIRDNRIDISRIADFTHKTLVIDFTSPQTVLSTLEGFSTNITAAANHYLPPPHLSGSRFRKLIPWPLPDPIGPSPGS
jgi:hypothetical protein